MDRDRGRWRIRLSTLMFLVVIAGLVLALILEKQNSARTEQRLRAEHQRAEIEAGIARTQMVYAQRARKIAKQDARDAAAGAVATRRERSQEQSSANKAPYEGP
jgi:uncharacterized protein HemX